MLKEPWIEVCGSMLVLLSSLLAAVGTLSLNPFWQVICEDVQNIIVSVFAMEFVARWHSIWPKKKFWGYLTQPLVLVDVVVVILPLVLPILLGTPFSQSGLVNLRLLRILRLQRVLQNMDTFKSFTGALGLPGVTSVQPYQLQLARVVLSIFTLLSVSTGLIYTAEHSVNPDMDNYFTALYFGLTTLTTVGFGDITPVTFQGKLVVCGSILAGVGVVGRFVYSIDANQSVKPHAHKLGSSFS
jgi:voltage-gated potassium channel